MIGRLVGDVDAGKIVVVGLMGGNTIAGKDQGKIEFAFPADRQGVVIVTQDQLDLPRLAARDSWAAQQGLNGYLAPTWHRPDLEFLERPAVPKGGPKPFAFELAKSPAR